MVNSKGSMDRTRMLEQMLIPRRKSSSSARSEMLKTLKTRTRDKHSIQCHTDIWRKYEFLQHYFIWHSLYYCAWYSFLTKENSNSQTNQGHGQTWELTFETSVITLHICRPFGSCVLLERAHMICLSHWWICNQYHETPEV